MTYAPDSLDDDDGDRIALGRELAEDAPNLGPDEHDLDLIDGSWERDYYAGKVRSVDWRAITVGIGLLVLISLLLPAILVLTH